MRHLLLCISTTLLLTDCAHKTPAVPKLTPPVPSSRVEPPPAKTKTSEARRQQLSAEYNEYVLLRMLSLDDGVTSPEVVARAALSGAGDRYRAWKRATVGEDLNLTTRYEVEQFESVLNDFPNQKTIDMWTGFVLDARKKNQKLTPKGKDRMRELGID